MEDASLKFVFTRGYECKIIGVLRFTRIEQGQTTKRQLFLGSMNAGSLRSRAYTQFECTTINVTRFPRTSECKFTRVLNFSRMYESGVTEVLHLASIRECKISEVSCFTRAY